MGKTLTERKMDSKKIENIVFYTAAAFVLITIFHLYSTFSQQYVGACDWYGYYQESLLLKNGRVSLETKIPAAQYPAIAPLSFYAINGKILGQYPPGFPLLMAGAGFLGLEFYVNPTLGVLSVILMFLTLFTLNGNDKWSAGLFALLWACFPLTMYGSTYVMSDLAAAFFILLAFYLLKIKKAISSALALGFSLAVRPTNVLFCAIFLPLAYKELNTRQRRYYCVWLGATVSLYAVYNWLIYGAPWKTGYMNILYNFSAATFTRNLGFYAGETLRQFTPLLALLALIALWKKDKHSLFLGAWFLVFLVFYSFWASWLNEWWWLRFLLPAFPALFILAGLGFKHILTTTHLFNRFPRRAAVILLTVPMLAVGIYFIHRGTHYQDLWSKEKGKLYYAITKKIEKQIPPGSLVGGCDFSGPLRLYANIESFGFFHLNSLYLISDMLKQGKPVYILEEPWHKENLGLKWILKNFETEKLTDVGVDSHVNFFLYRILAQKQKEILIPPGP
jgi:hypothetical protein